MIYHIAVCDDNKEDRKRLIRILREFEGGYMEFMISEFKSGEELIGETKQLFHALFLDIQMKELNGQETAMLVRRKDQHVVLCFYSGLTEPTPDSFRVQPFRYLTKNSSDEALRKDVLEAIEFMVEKNKQPTLWVQSGIANINILLDDILYIEKYKRGYCRIQTTADFITRLDLSKKDAVFVYAGTLDCLYEMLNEHGFEYAHSSYIVNFQHVIRYTRSEIVMKEFIPLALTRSKGAQFKQRMGEYMTMKMTKGARNG